jgi:hypothetical protein
MTGILSESRFKGGEAYPMTKRFILLISLITVICCTVWAADIDGKWTAEVQGRGGTQTQTLTLRSDGNNLTGSLDAGRGGAVDISGGTIDGTNVSFKVVREFNGNQVTREYKGTLSGSGELRLTVSGGGRGGRGRGGRGGPPQLVFKKATD